MFPVPLFFLPCSFLYICGMFFQKRPFFIILALPAFLFLACASPKTPTGGPIDELPPVVIAEESTPNGQTNFTDDVITITFDEWFTIKDVNTQMVISPLMPEQPEVKQKGKSIVIELPDSLSTNTTYTINFGSSIADLHEGNVLENFAFVFSTGDVLDSIKLRGKVTNASTLSPAEGVWVMLYPVGIDSAVYKRKPEYVAKTNKEGQWSLSNIRADSFSVVALKDDNVNFLYDQESELFGWIDYTIYALTPTALLPEIQVFPMEKRPAIREVIHDMPGWLKLVIDAPLPKPVPELLPPLPQALTAWTGDTLHVWYTEVTNYIGSAILNTDTTKIRAASRPSLSLAPITIRALTGRLYPYALAEYATSAPFAAVDTSKITLVHDSLGVIPFTIETDTIGRRTISVKAAWQPVSRHTLTFLPGAVTDIWGRMNDTIKNSIVANAADQFGDLTLNVEGLDSTKSYVLLVKSADQIVARYVIEQQKTAQLKKMGMAPGKYNIELFEDLNRNGIWDTGSYKLRRQPEKKMLFTPDNMRAAWELETKITWK